MEPGRQGRPRRDYTHVTLTKPIFDLRLLKRVLLPHHLQPKNKELHNHGKTPRR
jgi:hypothetical protein